jgi:thymidylate synthase
MLNLTVATPVMAWEQCLHMLNSAGKKPQSDKFYRDELVVIEVLEPCIEKIPAQFPMSQKDIDIINNYIVTGEREAEVVHEWTKLYYHRIYDAPNSQYEYILNNLITNPQSGRTQISFWDKKVDQDGIIAPCTQIIWARNKNDRLEFHVHAASVNAYNKLLMNQQEFISLQIHLADKLGIGLGKFYHIIDSCHIHLSDLSLIKFFSTALDCNNR